MWTSLADMGAPTQLLALGAPRAGRAGQPEEGDRWLAVPGGEIYLSFPGLGDLLAAGVTAEIGAITNFEGPNGLQCEEAETVDSRRVVDKGCLITPLELPGGDGSGRLRTLAGEGSEDAYGSYADDPSASHRQCAQPTVRRL